MANLLCKNTKLDCPVAAVHFLWTSEQKKTGHFGRFRTQNWISLKNTLSPCVKETHKKLSCECRVLLRVPRIDYLGLYWSQRVQLRTKVISGAAPICPWVSGVRDLGHSGHFRTRKHFLPKNLHAVKHISYGIESEKSRID